MRLSCSVSANFGSFTIGAGYRDRPPHHTDFVVVNGGEILPGKAKAV